MFIRMGLGTHIAESANLEDDFDFECPRVHVRNASIYSEELLEPLCAELIGGWVNHGEQTRGSLSTEMEMWLTLLARTKTQFLMPFLIICLGLLALKRAACQRAEREHEDVWTGARRTLARARCRYPRRRC